MLFYIREHEYTVVRAPQFEHRAEFTEVRVRILQSYLGPTVHLSRDPRRKSVLCHSELVCVILHKTPPQ